jgi:hypothetical protein
LPANDTLEQWVETDRKAWRELPPIISLVYEQEIGMLMSIRFHSNERVQGLAIDEAWDILKDRWIAAKIIKREHSTVEALEAATGKFAKEDQEVRKAAAMAADIGTKTKSRSCTHDIYSTCCSFTDLCEHLQR